MERASLATLPVVALIVMSLAANAGQIPTWMVGTWSGSAEVEHSPYGIHLTVTRAGSYHVSYPSLHCGGYWSLNRTSKRVATFREHITSGKCVDGTVTITAASIGPNGTPRKLDYEW